MSALLVALRLTCCCCWLAFIVFLIRPSCGLPDQEQVHRRDLGSNDASSLLSGNFGDVEVYDDDDLLPDELDEDLEGNFTSANGQYLGSKCNLSCNPLLQHVFCDSVTGKCECEKLYPVRLGPTKGCAKPKKLGEQCYYRATCLFTDQHSTCAQIKHNAVCDCEDGYHRVTLSRPNKKVFCAEDLVLIKTDIPTLLGIASGLAVLTGLICFVLKLFSSARYTRPRHFANANHAPPMLFSSDIGIPLALHGGRPSSRSSQRSSGGTLNFTRRPSSAGSRGPLVPASRAGAARAAAILLISCHRQSIKGGNKHQRALSDVAEGSSDGLGSRRPSLASVHSTTSSARSFSARRLERERNEKEQRQALQELRLTKQRDQQQPQQQQIAPTPSPRTPHSTDELLPAVEEGKELFYNENCQCAQQVPTTSGTSGMASTTTRVAATKEVTPATITPLFDKDTPSTTTDIFKSS
ncbi:uncharacterized protein LOC117170779 [Belonocnema kinseyi]|uniref:uncharacterized protein LOC117170779 n=1 Tax=Belonocnema kinseyi TaxID=2817044 RepID=UPI00143CC8CD|nr:uncharacterized protein LOC117170779 [Belonocnema kinseyi]